MARIIMTILGLILLGLGIWTTILWWPEVKTLLLACIALGLLLIGLAVVIFGISELVGALPHKTPAGTTPPGE